MLSPSKMASQIVIAVVILTVDLSLANIGANFTSILTSPYIRNSRRSTFSSLSPPEQYLPEDAESSEYAASSIVLEKLLVPTKSLNRNEKNSDDSPEGDSRSYHRLEEPTFHGDQQANVLILHPIYAGSHEVVLRALGVELVKRGHQVTQLRWKCENEAIDIKRRIFEGDDESPSSISTIEDGDRKGARFFDDPANTTFAEAEEERHVNIITVSADNSDFRYPYMSQDGTLQPPAKLLWDTDRSIFNVPTDVFGLIDAHCSTLLGDQALLRALNATRYTVALVDVIANECSLALARLLDIPVVGYWGFPFQGGEARRMGVLQPPSVVPALMSELGGNMNFWQRLQNFLLVTLDELLVTYHISVTDHWIKKLQPQLPSSSELLHAVDAMLVAVGWPLDYPKMLPPHVHYIGCLLCRPGAPLDQHLQDWVAGSGSDGVIVFSFGLTGFDPSVVPERFREGALKALSQLRQRVVLHFDPEQLRALPSNVIAMRKIPQQDLLAHPQTRLFVSHCGMNSVNEAAYHGVPVLCVPNFADQGDISRRVQDRGLGLTLAKQDLREQTLLLAIREMLANPRYRLSAKRISKLWQWEASGLETAIHWIIKVHTFGSLDYMRPLGSDLSLLQYFSIDVLAFILGVLLAWTVTSFAVLKLCSRVLWNRYCAIRKKVKTQ